MPPPETKPFEEVLAGNSDDIRKSIAGYLRSHRGWYLNQSNWYGRAWNAGTLLIVLFGTVSSIVAAYPKHSPYTEFLTIVLPALSSLIASVLIQFRVRDMWRLREIGRIESEILIAKSFSLPNHPTELVKGAIALRQLAVELERAQMGEFFADRNSQASDSGAAGPDGGKT